MSIFSKINRIISLRNGIRNRLAALGLVSSSAKLEDCKTALERMTDNTKKTTTSNPIKGTFYSGATQKVFGKVGGGYCSASSLVEILVVNLKSENIKSGVSVGGVVGTNKDEPSFIADVNLFSDSTYLMFHDSMGYICDISFPREETGEYVNPSCRIHGTLVVLWAVGRNTKLVSGRDFNVLPNIGMQYTSLGRITGPNPVIRVDRTRNL